MKSLQLNSFEVIADAQEWSGPLAPVAQCHVVALRADQDQHQLPPHLVDVRRCRQHEPP